MGYRDRTTMDLTTETHVRFPLAGTRHWYMMKAEKVAGERIYYFLTPPDPITGYRGFSESPADADIVEGNTSYQAMVIAGAHGATAVPSWGLERLGLQEPDSPAVAGVVRLEPSCTGTLGEMGIA